MFSKAYIRTVSVVGIPLVIGLIILTNYGQLMLQAHAIDPQTALSGTTQESKAPAVEAPMAQPAAEVPEHSGAQPADTLDEASIKEGKAIFESRCNACHTTPRATAHTMSEWPESLSRMAPRSFLRDSEVKLILLYLKQELKSEDMDEATPQDG